jgi:hypothetical protein
MGCRKSYSDNPKDSTWNLNDFSDIDTKGPLQRAALFSAQISYDSQIPH